MTRASDDLVDLSRYTKRQLLVRLVRTLDRMDLAMSAASEYITAALDSLDTQMRDLKTRLTGDADALVAAQAALATALADDATDKAAVQAAQDELSAAADRVQATAVEVAGLAQPTAVADPGTPDEATPIDPSPAPADPEAPVVP